MKRIILSVFSLFSAFYFSQELNKDSTNQPKQIQEVIIKALRKKQEPDKAIYTFDKEAVQAARHSKDLLASLPEIQIDALSNCLSSIKGDKILFLINGIEASDLQFSSVSPENVVRVEYFDIVPTRWANKADAVVNLITRNPEYGLAYGADVMGVFYTGFLNGQAYASYTRGKNELGLEYAFQLRDYDNRVIKKTYQYSLNNIDYQSYGEKKDHFGYTTQDFAMRYTYVNPEKEIFQAKLNFNLLDDFNKSNGKNSFQQGKITSLNATKDRDIENYLSPTLDLYYSKNIGKKDELVFNFVGSLYHNKTYQNNREWVAATGADVFNNQMSLVSRQKSFVAELSHYHTFKNSKLNIGYRFNNNLISSELSNLLGYSSFSVNYMEQYFYSDFTAKKGQFSYRLGLGAKNIRNKSAETIFNEWTATPRIVLSYSLKKNQTLRLTSVYQPQSPSSSELSPNVVMIAPYIIKRGNPLLKSEKRWTNNLMYSYYSKYFDFNTTLGYTHTDRIINEYYTLDHRFAGYTLTHKNADFYQNYRWEFSGSIKPFGNKILVIKAYLRPTAEKIKLEDGRMIKNFYVRNYINITSLYKKFFASYQFNIPTYSIDGAFLSSEENKSHFSAGYQSGNWSIRAGIFWLGTPSEYNAKSQAQSLVNFTRNTQILNNQNMFFVGASYHFSRGKNNQIQKVIENQTAQSAGF